MTGFRIPFTGLQRQYNQLREEILDVTDELSLHTGSAVRTVSNMLPCATQAHRH
jgi:hypothetical protein